jgi:LacI family transcriptional regulator
VETRIRIIGLVVPDLTDTHFAEVARGVSGVMQPKGYTVLVSNSEGDAGAERQAVNLLCTCPHVEGLIIASSLAPEDSEFFARVSQYKPFVLIDRSFPGIEANYVGADDVELGCLATEHLVSRGCRHIAHIRGPECSAGAGRVQGYQAALSRHGLKVSPGYVAPGGSNDAAGYEAMRMLLAVNPRLDGVVCYNDAVAVGAIKMILEAGLEVPYDIEVIGAGNVHYSDILRVPLSTIDLNSTLMGERAAGLLSDLIEAAAPPPPRRISIPFELVARESSKAAVA